MSFLSTFKNFGEACDRKGVIEETHMYSHFRDYPKTAKILWFMFSRFNEVTYEYNRVGYSLAQLLERGIDPSKTRRMIVL